MNTVKVPVTGSYTVLVGDCSDTNSGNYEIYAQRTDNPIGAVPVYWGQTQAGKIGSAAQSNTYTFVGTANNVVDFTMVATSGSLSPKIRLYNPDGSLLSSAAPLNGLGYCTGASTVEMNSVTLAQNGTYTVLVGDCSDTNAGNYNLSSECFGTCKVTPLITWAPPASINYGTPLSGTQLDATASYNGSPVAGTPTYKPPIGTVLKAGPQTLSVLFTPTDSNEFTTSSDSVPLTVNKATPACTWAPPAPITYGTPLSGTQLDASCSVPGSFVYSPVSGKVPPAGLQTLTFIFTPTDSTDYTTVKGSVPLTVNKVVLTVTANNASRVYGTPNPTFAFSITGFANGDQPSVVSGTPVLTTTAGASSQVGTYPITVTIGTLSAANYTFKFVNGTLTITQAKPVITWPTPAPIFVGTPLSGTQLDATASYEGKPVAGSYVYSPAAGAVPPLGVNTLKVIFTPKDTTDFTTATSSVTLTVINPYAATPKFSVAAGTYGAVQLVSLTDATPGATIYYTTNGQAPTSGSTKYTGPITVSSSETIEAFAAAPSYTNSAVASAAYKIVGSPSALAAPATAISTPDATLNAIVNTLGVAGSYVFQYGSSATTLTTITPKTPLGASAAAVPVSAKIAGLASKTTYYYQVVVTTAGGTGTGAVLSFTTN
jgi:hypothetical protein